MKFEKANNSHQVIAAFSNITGYDFSHDREILVRAYKVLNGRKGVMVDNKVLSAQKQSVNDSGFALVEVARSRADKITEYFTRNFSSRTSSQQA